MPDVFASGDRTRFQAEALSKTSGSANVLPSQSLDLHHVDGVVNVAAIGNIQHFPKLVGLLLYFPDMIFSTSVSLTALLLLVVMLDVFEHSADFLPPIV